MTIEISTFDLVCRIISGVAVVVSLLLTVYEQKKRIKQLEKWLKEDKEKDNSV